MLDQEQETKSVDIDFLQVTRLPDQVSNRKKYAFHFSR